jgi:hypothetical protein
MNNDFDTILAILSVAFLVLLVCLALAWITLPFMLRKRLDAMVSSLASIDDRLYYFQQKWAKRVSSAPDSTSNGDTLQ